MARMKILRSTLLVYPPPIQALEYAPPWAQAQGPSNPQADWDANEALVYHGTSEMAYPGGAKYNGNS
ncbi:hypothetical protein AHAS_Ahas18G0157200 [Arachis hypogaea]